MPLGDWRYRTRVAREAQEFAREQELSLPDTVVESGDAPPYYPASLRAFLSDPASENGGNAANGDRLQSSSEPETDGSES